MSKTEYIKIGGKAIAFSNIKNCYISDRDEYGEICERIRPIGEYRRKIWFSDYIRKKTCDPKWEKTGLWSEYAKGYSSEWVDYIDMDALDAEYQKVKEAAVQKGEEKKQHNKKKNRFTSLFKNAFGTFGAIEEELSHQEVIVPFKNEKEAGRFGFLKTEGKLYYNGEILRCIGSPFEGVKRSTEIVEDFRHIDGSYKREIEMSCSQSRRSDKESALIDSGELSKIYYRENAALERYLHLLTSTYGELVFTENECDMDNILSQIKEYQQKQKNHENAGKKARKDKKDTDNQQKQKNFENTGEKEVEYAIKWFTAASDSHVVSILNNCESKYRYNCILLCKPDFIDEAQEYDHILVCTAGIVLIETKHWKGTVEIREDGKWTRKPEADSEIVGVDSPKFQMRRHEILMQKILPAIPVHSLLCFSNSSTIIDGRENFKDYPIIMVDQLEETLSGLCLEGRYTNEEIDKMAAVIEAYKVGRR